MSKILGRIAIIGLIVWGAWYLLNKEEVTTENEFVEIEKTEIPAKKDENLTFEIKRGNKTTTKITQKISKTISTVSKKSIASVKVEELTNNGVVVNSHLTTNISKFAEKGKNTAMNIYFYDYEIDLSANTIPAGNVTFRAVNNGRLSHNLTLKDGNGQVNFGRIAPGETKFFQTNLDSGTFEVLSLTRIDEEKGMTETLTVQ